MFRSRSFKFYVALMFVLVLATTAYAFAASNTVNTTTAGEGVSVTSGYTVSNVKYVLNSSTPSNIDSVTFTLNAAATFVRIKLVAAGSTYYSCSNVGLDWTCATTSPQVTVLAATELRIIASDSVTP